MDNRLLWTGVKKTPKNFDSDELKLIFETALKPGCYWSKNNKEWGNFLRSRNFTLVATIYLLGLRPREACRLMFLDLDFNHSYIKISGENNKTKKDRTVPIPKNLVEILKNYLKYNRARFWRGCPYLFPSMEGGPISPERIKAIFREKILKPAGIYENPKAGKYTPTRLYALRHSRATQIMKKQIKETGQADLYAIANILGHSDLRSTLIYLHKDEEYNNYLRTLLE